MPFPSTQEQMFAAGYSYLKWERCPVCGLDVEVWSTPGKRTVAMEPMPGIQSEAIRHYLRCNIAPKQEEQSGETTKRADSKALGKDNQGDGDQQAGPRSEAQSTERAGGVSSAAGSGIKLYGVR